MSRNSTMALAAALSLAGGVAGAVGPASAAERVVRGIVQAEAEAQLSTELVAPVARVPFKAGEAFAAGDALVTFDCRRYAADLNAARAEARAAEVTRDMNQRLRQHNAIGLHELELSEIKAEQARAQLEALRVRTDQCTMRAPFDGRIVERQISEHEMPKPGEAMLRIVKTGRLEVGLIVPSHWLVWLRPGGALRFEVEETATTHEARIVRVGAVVDPVSRTVLVVADLLKPSELVRPGMSGRAMFAQPKP